MAPDRAKVCEVLAVRVKVAQKVASPAFGCLARQNRRKVALADPRASRESLEKAVSNRKPSREAKSPSRTKVADRYRASPNDEVVFCACAKNGALFKLATKL